MRKNQQGGNPRSGASSNQQKETGGLQAAATSQASSMLGFGQVAAEQSQNHHLTTAAATRSSMLTSAASLTPNYGTSFGNSQSLATMGLPPHMGLSAIGTATLPATNISGTGPKQMAFGQIVTNQDKQSSNQLTAKQIDRIGKELEQCATQGDADEMQEILASHHDVIPKKTLNVALRAAVKGCTTHKLDYSIQCTELLVEAGANINSEEANEGKTALMMSCEKGYLELVKNLLDHEALIDHKDQKKRTPLMYAIGTNAQNLDVVQELLNRGADVNEQTLTGLTPLLLATKKEHTQICKLLLSRGADIAAQFPEDLNSCLHYACIQGNIMTLNTLLDHSKMKLSEQLTQEFLYLLNKNSKTALQIAGELHSAQPENDAYGQIYSEMSVLHQQKEQAVDDLVQTLLKKEDSTLNNDQQHHAAQPNSSNQSQTQQVTGGGGKRGGGRHQLKAKKQLQNNTSAAPEAEEDFQDNLQLDAAAAYQNDRSVSPVAAIATSISTKAASRKQSNVSNEVKAELEIATSNTMSATKASKSGKQSKKAKKQGNKAAQQQQAALVKNNEAAINFAVVFQAVVKGNIGASEPLTDEDEYKSAESKTPPSQKAVDQPQVTTTTSRYGGTKANQQHTIPVQQIDQDSDTVTEHSSDDEDHFVDTRTTPNTTAPSSVTPTTNTNTKPPPQNTSTQQQTTGKLTKSKKKQLNKQNQQQQTLAKQAQQQSNKNAGTTTAKQKQSSIETLLTLSFMLSKGGDISTKGSQQPKSAILKSQSQHQDTSSLPPWMQMSAQSSSLQSQQTSNNAASSQQTTTPNLHNQSNSQSSASSTSQGAVQKPIINQSQTTQSSWPQVLIQKIAASSVQASQNIDNNQNNHRNSPSNQKQHQQATTSITTTKQQQRKQNAAVVENLKPNKAQQQQQSQQFRKDSSNQQQVDNESVENNNQNSMDSNNNSLSEHGVATQHQQIMKAQSVHQPQNIDNEAACSNTGGSATYPRNSNNTSGMQQQHLQQQQHQQQYGGGIGAGANLLQQHQMNQSRSGASAAVYNNQNNSGVLSTPGATSTPITLFKSLDTRKIQFDFILEQQEMRNKMLTFQLYSHKERMREVELDVKQRKQDHIVRVNEYYNQANRYYENFSQLETAMNSIADKNENTLKGSMNLLGQLRDNISGHDPQTRDLIQQIEQNLRTMEDTNKKFTNEMDFRKMDEKSYNQNQEDQRQQQEKNSEEQSSLQNDMAFMNQTNANKQVVAKTQIQYNNLFIEMENAFGEESEQSLYQQSTRYPQQVFNKLHDEVILFDESVKSIMDEIEPIKKIIIDKISGFIKLVIPNGDVEVYGSHATKLCLHWSDIDLILKPAPKDGLYISNVTNMRNWLNLIYNELIKSENRCWLQKVDFIENTTVPVIKLACSILSQNANGQLLLPNGQVPRYPDIVSKPINVDITLWSENHNGLPCVKLVRSYLSESQLIEPLILVLKQMLKVWGFNDAYTGGLSSYALFLMIVSFLQEKRKPALKSEVNMGETLLEFIRYYAQLDFSQYAICCKLPGEQSEKQNLYLNTNSDFNFFLQPRVVIDDPLMASNNVGKSAFRFQEIKSIMSHAYNSVFTGCFCSCHYKSLCRNTSYQSNAHTYHKSQLLAFNTMGQQLPSAPTSYLSFQHPPSNKPLPRWPQGGDNNPNQSATTMNADNENQALLPTSVQARANESDSNVPATNDEGNDPQSQVQAATINKNSQQQQPNNQSNQAPYPAGMAPQLRTQSQPFQIGGGRGDAPSQANNAAASAQPWQNPAHPYGVQQQFDAEVQCSCDSILSRLIYGYNNYRRTMESLHPNFGTIQMQPTYQNNQAGINGTGFGLAGLNAMPFMGGQNL